MVREKKHQHMITQSSNQSINSDSQSNFIGSENGPKNSAIIMNVSFINWLWSDEEKMNTHKKLE